MRAFSAGGYMKRFFFRVFCGFFLGLSMVAPGISGSVIAVMLDIYDELVGIAAHPFKKFKRNFFYLLPMGIGALLSLALFVLSFSYLFDTYPTATSLLFTGLIAGNVPYVYRQTKGSGLKPRYVIGLVIAFALALGCGILGMSMSAQKTVAMLSATAAPIVAPGLVIIAISGVLAGIVGLIPGMSVSMILMMLGSYYYLIQAARNFLFLELAVFGVALVAAVVLFSRLVKLVLNRYHYFSYHMILGFVLGSLVSIVLELPAADSNFKWWIGILAVGGGLSLSLLFSFIGKKLNSHEDDVSPDSQD